MSGISGIATYQSYQSADVFALNQPRRGHAASIASAGKTQGASSRGADTISLSPEVVAMWEAAQAQAENSAGTGKPGYKSPEALPADAACGIVFVEKDIDGKIINRKSYDIAQSLRDLAATDLKAFREIMEKINNGDPGDLLSAISELIDVPQADIQQTIKDMTEEDREWFAAGLASLSDDGSASIMFEKLTEITSLELLDGQAMADELQEIADKDFMEFHELAEKLKSEDPAVLLNAMSELSGLPEEDVQRCIELMSKEKLQELSAHLGRAIDAPAETLFAALMQLPGIDAQSWANSVGSDEPSAAQSRLNAKAHGE